MHPSGRFFGIGVDPFEQYEVRPKKQTINQNTMTHHLLSPQISETKCKNENQGDRGRPPTGKPQNPMKTVSTGRKPC